MRRFTRLAPVLILLAVLPALIAAVQEPTGPLPSVTGAPPVAGTPGELDCTLCHMSIDIGWNNLNTPGGAVEILDTPATYLPGALYPLRVRLHSDSTAAFADRQWGFEFTAVSAVDGGGAGSFELSAPDSMQVVAGDPGGPWPSRNYVEHILPGVRPGLGGPVEWSFAWRAPDPPRGKIYFFCAGNAANGGGTPDSDYVFTSADSTVLDPTPARAVTWGQLKSRYR